MTSKLHWGRVIVAGLLAEIALILAIVPFGLRLGDAFLKYAAPPGSFVVCFVGAVWVSRKTDSRFVVRGLLAGIVAAVLYVLLSRFQPEPPAYLLAHALKFVGGATGGWVGSRRTS